MTQKMIQPGDLFRAHQSGKQGAVAHQLKRMKAALPSLKTQHSGTFQGKSNVLGHGGRAAQLKARGVPGGVIGMLARRAGAAPGGPHYHGHKKRKGSSHSHGHAHKAVHVHMHKTAEPKAQELGMAFKRRKSSHSHGAHHKAVHVHMHKRKHSASAVAGLKHFVQEEATEKKRKSSHSHGHAHKAVHVHMHKRKASSHSHGHMHKAVHVHMHKRKSAPSFGQQPGAQGEHEMKHSGSKKKHYKGDGCM